MKKSLKVRGDPENGHNIAVPMAVKPKAGDRYEFMEIIEGGYDTVTLPIGSLVYIPVSHPTSKREKKGVSG
jgi:hypothetical protein